MKSVYYKVESSGAAVPFIKIANPYRHLTVFNNSPSDIEIRLDNLTAAFIPENASLTLFDVFPIRRKKFEFADTVLYFHTVPFSGGDVNVHLINFGDKEND